MHNIVGNENNNTYPVKCRRKSNLNKNRFLCNTINKLEFEITIEEIV